MMAKAITYLVADDMLSIAGMLDGKTQLSRKAADADRDYRGADQAGHHAFLTNMASVACRALPRREPRRNPRFAQPEPGCGG